MYTNSAAIFRGDIAGVVEQAKDYEAGLIGVQVMPILDVPVRAGQYPSFVLKEGQLLKSDVKNRAAYSAYARGTRAFNQDTYTALEYGYEEAVDDTVTLDVAARISTGRPMPDGTPGVSGSVVLCSYED
jgi:hypothetical protein